MALQVKALAHGYRRGDFFDLAGTACSIQESADQGAEGPYLLVGANKSRMFLDRKRVAELLPLMLTFVETGRLP